MACLSWGPCWSRSQVCHPAGQTALRHPQSPALTSSLLLLPAVQPPPPKDVHISTTGAHFLLTWSVPLRDVQRPWLSQGDLEFEVVYRRLQDSWEVGPTVSSAPDRGQPGQPSCSTSSLPQDGTTLQCTSSHVVLEPELLMPSTSYVARVRTKLTPGSSLSGRPSRWSPEVHWDSQPGSEPRAGWACRSSGQK